MVLDRVFGSVHNGTAEHVRAHQDARCWELIPSRAHARMRTRKATA